MARTGKGMEESLVQRRVSIETPKIGLEIRLGRGQTKLGHRGGWSVNPVGPPQALYGVGCGSRSIWNKTKGKLAGRATPSALRIGVRIPFNMQVGPPYGGADPVTKGHW